MSVQRQGWIIKSPSGKLLGNLGIFSTEKGAIRHFNICTCSAGNPNLSGGYEAVQVTFSEDVGCAE